MPYLLWKYHTSRGNTLSTLLSWCWTELTLQAQLDWINCHPLAVPTLRRRVLRVNSNKQLASSSLTSFFQKRDPSWCPTILFYHLLQYAASGHAELNWSQGKESIHTENHSKLSSEQLVGGYQRELLMLQTCGGLHHDLRAVLPELNGREHDGKKSSRNSWLTRRPCAEGGTCRAAQLNSCWRRRWVLLRIAANYLLNSWWVPTKESCWCYRPVVGCITIYDLCCLSWMEGNMTERRTVVLLGWWDDHVQNATDLWWAASRSTTCAAWAEWKGTWRREGQSYFLADETTMCRMLQTCGGLHHDLRPVLPELNRREHDREKNSRTSWLTRRPCAECYRPLVGCITIYDLCCLSWIEGNMTERRTVVLLGWQDDHV